VPKDEQPTAPRRLRTRTRFPRRFPALPTKPYKPRIARSFVSLRSRRATARAIARECFFYVAAPRQVRKRPGVGEVLPRGSGSSDGVIRDRSDQPPTPFARPTCPQPGHRPRELIRPPPPTPRRPRPCTNPPPGRAWQSADLMGFCFLSPSSPASPPRQPPSHPWPIAPGDQSGRGADPLFILFLNETGLGILLGRSKSLP